MYFTPKIYISQKVKKIIKKNIETVLKELKKVSKTFKQQSDFGWLMTLGSEALGMLMAVSSDIESKWRFFCAFTDNNNKIYKL